jgi:hypothetical protein
MLPNRIIDQMAAQGGLMQPCFHDGCQKVIVCHTDGSQDVYNGEDRQKQLDVLPTCDECWGVWCPEHLEAARLRIIQDSPGLMICPSCWLDQPD